MKRDETLHDGHRERLREKYRRGGAAALADHELIELLLFYAIPRRDTNETAHRLLRRFGSLQAVFDAPIRALEQVDGVGPKAAELIRLVCDLGVQIQAGHEGQTLFLQSTEQIGAYLRTFFAGIKAEQAVLLCMDSLRRVLFCQKIIDGSLNQAALSFQKIMRIAINTAASCVVIAHNHPSGNAVPSGEDLRITQELKHLFDKVNIQLVDHLIFTNDDFVSLRESNARYRIF